MNTQTAALIAVAVLALVVIYALARFARVKAGLKGLGVGLDVEASGEGRTGGAGVTAERVVSRQGSIVAADSTGQGARGSDLDAHGDVRITSGPPPAGPKAEPPA